MSGIDERPKKKRLILRSLRPCFVCRVKTELVFIRKLSFPHIGVHGNIVRFKCPDCLSEFSVTRRMDIPLLAEDIEIVR